MKEVKILSVENKVAVPDFTDRVRVAKAIDFEAIAINRYDMPMEMSMDIVDMEIIRFIQRVKVDPSSDQCVDFKNKGFTYVYNSTDDRGNIVLERETNLATDDPDLEYFLKEMARPTSELYMELKDKISNLESINYRYRGNLIHMAQYLEGVSRKGFFERLFGWGKIRKYLVVASQQARSIYE